MAGGAVVTLTKTWIRTVSNLTTRCVHALAGNGVMVNTTPRSTCAVQGGAAACNVLFVMLHLGSCGINEKLLTCAITNQWGIFS